jgi:hypothetical protein
MLALAAAVGCGDKKLPAGSRSLDGFLAAEDMASPSMGGAPDLAGAAPDLAAVVPSDLAVVPSDLARVANDLAGVTPAALDVNLKTPGAGGTKCTQLGYANLQCLGNDTCRPYSTTEGRCEAGGSQPQNVACISSGDCQVQFTCFFGQCQGYCEVGSDQCLPGGECVDVGYRGVTPTLGVCKPL